MFVVVLLPTFEGVACVCVCVRACVCVANTLEKTDDLEDRELLQELEELMNQETGDIQCTPS